MLRELDFYKGVNLGGWMSQCDYSPERLDGFITSADFALIADWGFDHVRLPIDYNVIQDSAGDMMPEGLRRVDRALSECEKRGLRAVLDLHKTQGFSFDAAEGEAGFFQSPEYQRRFFTVWETFAGRYGREAVLFDLLNEVTTEDCLAPWKRISRECFGRIRELAPEVPVILGSYQWNSARTVPALDPPFDGRTAYSFHFYEPHDFTHQGAYWEPERDQARRWTYAESGASRQFMEDFLAPALEKAGKEGCDLYCGEYGVIDVVPPAEAMKWFRDFHAVMERHGISRCMWSWKQMDFGLTDKRLDPCRDELLTLI